MRKRITPAFMTLLMLICFMVNTHAALPETVEPLWDNIQNASIDFFFNNPASVVSTITGKTGMTNITATLNVYQQTDNGWTVVGRDYGSTSARSLALRVEYDAVPGATYQAVLNFSVTINGVVETETLYEYATCPKN